MLYRVTAGTLDTIEQSVVCAAEYSVPSVAAPMCCPGSPVWRFGVSASGVRGLLPFRVFETRMRGPRRA